MTNEQIAEVAHEVNRAYCTATGDDSQPAWNDAPDWQRTSAINGVESHLRNDLTPEQSHELWSKEKIADGWVYDETKDPVNKTHPCLVPYTELPASQRVKDYLFAAVVKTLKGAAS